MINTGKEIRRLRLSKNMTQIDLAESTGLQRSYISHIERNIKHPSFATLKKIADALDMELKIEFVKKIK